MEPKTPCPISEQGRGARADILLCFDHFVYDLRGSNSVEATTQ